MHGEVKIADRTVELLPNEADNGVGRQVGGGGLNAALRDHLAVG